MGTLGRSTVLADGSGGSGSGSGPARFGAGEERNRRRIDDSGGTRVGSGGSGGELVRSFVELVKTVEAKVSVGMSFGDMDTCMTRLRGSESVGELESGLGDERRVVSIGSKTNSDANVGGDEENGNCCDENKTNSGVDDGVEENGKCLDEIGEELDGGIEVPIAGTSENGEDRVGEELGDGVNEFCIGDFVWGKIKNHPWWPGQICDPSNASELAAKLRSKDKLLVAYFGDDTFAWCHPSQLKPFEENFVENSKLSSSKVFVIAVQQAVDEIGRLVKLKMSCGCMGEEFVSGCKQPLASNAGVKEGVVVPEGRVGKFLGHLSQPVDLLAELKHMAQVVSLTSVLELNVLKSLLSAFYCSKGGYQLPVYIEPQLIPGLEDERKMVEIPVQWPSDDRSSSPIGSNTGNAEQNLLQRSPPNIENRQPHKRKEKSIADLLGEANGVEVKSMDGVVAKESAISEKRGLSSRRKKQKSSDIHESGRERAKLSKSPTSTKKAPLARRKEEDEGIGIESRDGLAKESAGGNEETKKTPLSRKRKRDEDSIDSKDGDTLEKSGGKDETKKAPLSRRRKKNEDIHINSNDGEAKGKAGARVGELLNVGSQTDMKDQIGKSPLLRERKKSKYLSPPFTISDAGKRKRNLETESPNAVTSHDLGRDSINSKDGDTLEKSGGKDETKKAPLLRRRKKNEDIHINSNDGEAKGKAGARVGELLNVGSQTDMKDQIGKSPLLRERKKSKYLSPPFTISDAGKRKRNLETESPNAVTSHDLGKEGRERVMESVLSPEVSSKAQSGERITRAAANIKGSPQILTSCSEALQEKLSIDGGNNSIDVKTPAEGEKKRVDPIKANAATNEVLSGVRSAALDPLYPVKRKSSFEIVVDFVSIFRETVYHNGCYHKLYKKHQHHGKRNKSDSEPGSLVKDNQTAANLRESESGKRVIKKKQDMKSDKPTKKQAGETRSSKRRKLNSVIKSLGKDNEKAENLPVIVSGQRNVNTNQDKPKKKQAAEPPISKLVRRRSKHAGARDLKIKETEEKAPPTFLFVTFGLGSSLPTKDDLLRLYSKFGELNETETEMFYTNFCARVAFVMSSDAEEAFNHSLIDNPFGASNVNFRLQNPSGASKTRELSEIPESPPAKKSRGKTASEALVASQPPAGEPSQVDFIRHRLQMMSSMLGNSNRKVSHVATSKIQNEIKELLKVVSTMGESSS